MRTSTRERRDWTLLIFIIPIGIILMLIAGQIAIRLVPIWSMNAGMQSNLDPNNLSQHQQNGVVQPVLPAILTPLGWLDTFLTPGADSGNQNVVFPPFVVFEPTATPAITLPPTTVATTPPSPPSVTVSPTTLVIPPTTGTQKPPEGGTSATTAVPTATTAVPTATTAVPTATTAVPTATTAVPTGFPSTPFGTQVMSTPVGFNVGAPNGTISGLSDNSFFVIDLGSSQSNQIQVNGSSETNYYDMVYYERQNPLGYISMDQVIIGISQFPNGSIYYTVFNWGNGVPDTNSNVGGVAGTEADNQLIATTTLYGTPPYQTGIAIDVDKASSAPPVGWYQYIVIQSPVVAGGDGGLDVDSVQVTEVHYPTPILLKSSTSIQSENSTPSDPAVTSNLPADTGQSQSADDAASNLPADVVQNSIANPSVDAVQNPPVDTVSVPPADVAQSQPADNPSVSVAQNPPADTVSAPPADNAPSPSVDNAPVSVATP